MIKTFLMATVGMAVAVGAASAADLPSRRAPPVYVPPIAAPFSWTGLEFGLTTSYSFAGSRSVRTIDPLGNANYASLSKGGFDNVGGGAGYNYQLTPGSGVVIGAIADVSYFNLHKTAVAFGNDGFAGAYQQRVAYVGTANGRLGYAFDRVLVYGVGGFAFGELHNTAALAFAATPFVGTSGGISTGYDFGGGFEYAIPADSFLNYLSVEKLIGLDKQMGFLNAFAPTLRAEFVHYNLGSRSVASTSLTGAPAILSRFHTEGNLVRFGLGYKFGGTSAAPVVARY